LFDFNQALSAIVADPFIEIAIAPAQESHLGADRTKIGALGNKGIKSHGRIIMAVTTRRNGTNGPGRLLADLTQIPKFGNRPLPRARPRFSGVGCLAKTA
jgi:hypothetical protein